jgi:hypothetical protein
LLMFITRILVFRMLACCSLLLSWLPIIWLLHLLPVIRVFVFIVITVVEMDIWRLFFYRKKKAQKV